MQLYFISFASVLLILTTESKKLLNQQLALLQLWTNVCETKISIKQAQPHSAPLVSYYGVVYFVE